VLEAGQGRSRRAAEQEAAGLVLQRLKTRPGAGLPTQAVPDERR
jgi:dsRNA-specific ribonuclease